MPSSRGATALFLLCAVSACAETFDASLNATASHLRGIDVSHYQGSIDWHAVASSGISFACAKATEGTSYVDSTFATNWNGMRAAGLIRCAYHFARPGSNATLQALHFVDTVNKAGGFRASKTLQLMLDLESTDGLGPKAVWAWTQEFVAELKRLTGRPGIIYTGLYFWNGKVGAPADNLDCPLWVASYTHPAPAGIPKAWPEGWAFWQYSDNGASSPGGPAAHIPGVSGTSVDVDYFRYSETTLAKFCFP
jgi:GH25 family lysozyme M1 (1,4-beta-N-acetylmuramidase)